MTSFACTPLLFLVISATFADRQLGSRDVTPDAYQKIRSHMNEYAGSLLHQLSSERGSISVSASPFSILTALTSFMSVTGGETQYQLKEAVACHVSNKYSADALQRAFAQVYKEEINERKSMTPPVTVALVSDEPNQPTENELMKSLNTHLVAVDFDKSSKSSSDWITETTGGLVNGVVYVAPAPDTSILLINYMPFKGRWRFPFDPKATKLDLFHSRSILPTAHPLLKITHGTIHHFMHLRGQKLRYKKLQIAGETVQALELSFQDDNIVMVILLPVENDGLEKILSNDFEGPLKEAIAAINASMEEKVVNVVLPKFRAETQYAFDFLQGTNVNVTDIFSKEANLTGLAGDQKLHLTKLIHKSVIDLDENGSSVQPQAGEQDHKASNSSDAIDFRADHPFLYYIQDSATGVIFFIGRIGELETVS